MEKKFIPTQETLKFMEYWESNRESRIKEISETILEGYEFIEDNDGYFRIEQLHDECLSISYLPIIPDLSKFTRQKELIFDNYEMKTPLKSRVIFEHEGPVTINSTWIGNNVKFKNKGGINLPNIEKLDLDLDIEEIFQNKYNEDWYSDYGEFEDSGITFSESPKFLNCYWIKIKNLDLEKPR